MQAQNILNRLYHNSIVRRMFSGSVWSCSGTAVAKLLSLVAGIVCAHLLTKAQYGQLGIIRSTLNMFVVLGSVGIGVTVTRYSSMYLKSNPHLVRPIYRATNRFSLLVGFAVTALILLCAHPLAEHALHDASMATSLRFGAVLLFFSVLNGVQNGALSGMERFRDIAQNTLLGSIFEAVFMIAGAHYAGVEGAIAGFGLGFIVIYVANHISIRRAFRRLLPEPTADERTITLDRKILLDCTLPATLTALTITPVYWLIRSLLIAHGGYSELATFEAADQWKVVILYVPMAASQICLPILSSLQGGSRKTFARTLLLNVIIAGLTSLIISAVVMLLGKHIMGLYGREFNSTTALTVLMASTFFCAVANVLEMALYSLGRIWSCFAINVVWAAITVGTSYFLLVHYHLGAAALSWGILASYLFTFCAFSAYVYWLLTRTNLHSETPDGRSQD